MQRLLLIEVAVCAALIVVAVLVMVARWRRRRRRRSVPGRERRAAAARPTEASLARHPAAVVPGFTDDALLSGPGTPPGPGTQVPDRPDRAAGWPVSEGAGPQPEQAARGDVSDVPGPEPHLNGPARTKDGQLPATGAATGTEQVSSYYEEADRRMSDYLVALGWTEDPGAREPGPHDPGAGAE